MESDSNSEVDEASLVSPGSASEMKLESGSIPEMTSQPLYSIAAVSKLSGISCHTLRVWERRYGFPVPCRSPAGHRRYDRQQVQTLCRLSQLARAGGQSIGELISLVNDGHIDLGATELLQPSPASESIVNELIGRLLAGDNEGADREFARLAGGLDPIALVEQVIYPALVEAGEGWFRRNLLVYKERLLTVFLRGKLCGLIEQARMRNALPTHSVIIGTVQGDRHEGGVLIFNLAMELRGWKVYNLGVDLPAREYRAAVQDLRPSALALSFVLSRNIKKRFQELERIAPTPIFVGGRSIVNYQALARHHGLIPLPGPIGKAAEQFMMEYNQWTRRHYSEG
ncbi:MAG: MerR family transcriptional regulator [Isosphaeraceae bacterium]